MTQYQNWLAVPHIGHKNQSIDITYDFTNIFISSCFFFLSSQRQSKVEAEQRQTFGERQVPPDVLPDGIRLGSSWGPSDLPYMQRDNVMRAQLSLQKKLGRPWVSVASCSLSPQLLCTAHKNFRIEDTVYIIIGSFHYVSRNECYREA